jgi:Ribosomal protein L11, N-terminal domain
MQFCKEYNAATQDKPGVIVPVEITCFDVSPGPQCPAGAWPNVLPLRWGTWAENEALRCGTRRLASPHCSCQQLTSTWRLQSWLRVGMPFHSLTKDVNG